MAAEVKIEPGQIPQTQEELKAALGVQEQKPAEEQIIEVKLATGEVFKGKTQQEVIDALVKSKEEATTAIRDRERQIRELREEAEM